MKKQALTAIERLQRATTALKYLHDWNLVQNDWQAYCLAVARWGFGKRKTLPNPEDYGLGPEMAVVKQKQKRKGRK